MFGYVNVFQNELKIKEYNVYKAYYCGVCHSCGKNLSFFSRFTLSYDITFMALLLDSISDEKTACVPKRCMVHPLKKRTVAIENRAIDYSACVGIMLTYLKFKDDVKDDKSLKGLMGMLLLHRGVKKARKKFPGIYEEIEKLLCSLSRLEKEKCSSPDEVADVFGKLLGNCMMAPFAGEENKKQLYWLGYYVGRWIYLIDAVNDFEKDIKTQNYNPYKFSYNNMKELEKDSELPLTLTLESAASAFELLEIKKYRAILENILYLGMAKKQNEILKGTMKDESI